MGQVSVLPQRHQPEPGRHVAPSRKGFGVTHRRHQRRRGEAADAGHRRQSPRGFVRASLGHELGIEGGNPLVERPPLLAEIASQPAQTRAQAGALVSEDARQGLLQLATPLRHDNAAFQQQGPQVVDERCRWRSETPQKRRLNFPQV